MSCRTWNDLFEQYERAALQRVASTKKRFILQAPADLEDINVEIAKALRQLREHEKLHGCR
jgi:hypothetical protein